MADENQLVLGLFREDYEAILAKVDDFLAEQHTADELSDFRLWLQSLRGAVAEYQRRAAAAYDDKVETEKADSVLDAIPDDKIEAYLQRKALAQTATVEHIDATIQVHEPGGE